MTDHDNTPRSTALQELEAALDRHRQKQADADARPAETGPAAGRKRSRLPFDPRILLARDHPMVRRIGIAAAVLVVIVTAAGGGLWWRLSSGPIMLDVVTPWLTSAIEGNFGNRYKIQVGGTQLERDAQGHTALRLRDIAVRTAAGALVAVAPKAEVGLSGTSLFTSRPRAQSFRLVDANIVVRIAADGGVEVFAGGERPFATMPPGNDKPNAPNSSPKSTLQEMLERSAATNIAATLAWIDGLGGLAHDGAGSEVAGFDGEDLTEIGVTNGSITIDDHRDSREWNLKQISLRLIRPRDGGAALSVISENPDQSWVLNSSLAARRGPTRTMKIDARKVPVGNLLALGMVEGKLRSDTLVSAAIEAAIAADGMPQTVNGSVVAEGGSIGNPGDPDHSLPIERAEFGVDWDVARRTLRLPFKISSGKTRVTLRSEFAAPAQTGGNWQFAVGGGWILLDPLTPEEEGLVLKRVVVRGTIDPTNRRVALEQADFGTKEMGGQDVKDVSFAVSGNIDYSGEPRIVLGIAANQMTVASLRRMWPTFIAPKVRDWVEDHILSGTVDRVDVAANTLLETMEPDGPAIPDEGLSIDISASSVVLRPVEGLPVIRDADLTARITGRSATITLGKGNVDVSQGRRLGITNGLLEVADTRLPIPQGRVRFRVDGPVQAGAELLALDRLRDFSGVPFDPATTRGTLSAQVNLAIPMRPDLPKGSTIYTVNADLMNFSADKLIMGQKIEAAVLRVTAQNPSYQIKGDVKISGTPAAVEYRKAASDADGELKLQATLDEATRGKLGIDFGPTIVGSIPVKIFGRVNASDAIKLNVEADLTPVRVENLIPGWVKPPGKLARAAFTLSKDKTAIRLDDLLIDGQGVLAKGSVEFDNNNVLQTANFPVFATSDGDKTTVKVDRTPDGALRVVMRGDVYDGRNFVKGSMAGPPVDQKIKPRYSDLDIDVKLGVVLGHHGEALRGLDMRMSRRAGRIRSFNFNAKIGRDTPLLGDMRTRVVNSRQVLYFETNDAGALFRFSDVYPRMAGGKMWVALDPPSSDFAPQDGLISIRDFAIRGEAALDRVVAGAGNGRSSVDFSQARADFTRANGKLVVRDGVVRGPTIGATIEGQIDYGRDDVNMRGTLVPLYGLNNMFGQIPIVGLFLGGGSNEGLLGITYEVTGPIGNPRPQVNPLSAIAPGLLRKFFEFRDTNTERAFTEPSR